MDSKKERPGNYRIPVIIILGVLIMVIIRSFGPGFRPDAKKWAEMSFGGSEIISSEALESLPPGKLLISLDEENTGSPGVLYPVRITPDSILSPRNLKLIRKNKGPIVLFANDISVSARIWMILRQMGIKDIFILAENDIESQKNKFRPDTLFRPEL